MRVRVIEDDFRYQMKSIFKNMESEYKTEQQERIEDNKPVQTFADWLWKNKEMLGELVYERADEYFGIEESTEEFNHK